MSENIDTVGPFLKVLPKSENPTEQLIRASAIIQVMPITTGSRLPTGVVAIRWGMHEEAVTWVEASIDDIVKAVLDVGRNWRPYGS